MRAAGAISTGFGISFGGSGPVVLVARGRVPPKRPPEENDGDRFELSRIASDQLNPSEMSC
jgi:hypothetical protein